MRTLVVIAIAVVACGGGKRDEPGQPKKSGGEARAARARDVWKELARLDTRDVTLKAERLAAVPDVAEALATTSADDRARHARLGFQKWLANERHNLKRPDVVALVDSSGDIVAMHDVVSVSAKQWRNPKPDPSHPTLIPALDAALRSRRVVADLWVNDRALLRIGVAPVEGRGAVLVGYAMTDDSAQEEAKLLGAEVVYSAGKQVLAASDGKTRTAVSALLAAGPLAESVTLNGADHATATIPLESVTVAVLARVAPERDPEALVRAYQLIQRLHMLDAIDASDRVEQLAAMPELGAALEAETDAGQHAKAAFQKFVAGQQTKPDLVALVDAMGTVIAMHEGPVVAALWKDAAGKSTLPALEVALADKVTIADVWNRDGKTLMRIGVASVISRSAAEPNIVVGAVVVGYTLAASTLARTRALLEVDIGYYDRGRIVASTRATNEAIEQLVDQLATGGRASVTLEGMPYDAAGAKLPRTSSRALPPTYPPTSAGAFVLVPVR